MTDILLTRAEGDVTPIHALTEAALEAFLAGRSPALARLAKLQGFKAKTGQVLVAPDGEGDVALVGLGAGARADGMALRALPVKLPAGDYRLATPIEGVTTGAVALAWLLGAYAFDRYRKTPAEPRARLVVGEAGVSGGVASAREGGNGGTHSSV